MIRHVQIHIALNDWRNGEASGHARGLEVLDADGDIALSLDSIAIDAGPVCRVDDQRSRLKLGYHWYPIKGHRFWTGSWVCDSVLLVPETAARLLNEARASKWWTPDSGFEWYWQRWASDEPFTAAFFTAEQLVAAAGLA